MLLASYGDRLRRLGPMPKPPISGWRPCAAILPELFARLPKLKLDDYQPMLTLPERSRISLAPKPRWPGPACWPANWTTPSACWSRKWRRAGCRPHHALGQVMDKRRLTNKANEYYRQALQLADV